MHTFGTVGDGYCVRSGNKTGAMLMLMCAHIWYCGWEVLCEVREQDWGNAHVDVVCVVTTQCMEEEIF